MRYLNTKTLILLAFLIIIFSGCKQEKVKDNLLTVASGKPNEVLIVMEKNMWESIPGKSLKTLLQEDCPGLPQSEPLFNLMQIKRKAFTKIFRMHRNIILTDISEDVEKEGIKVEYNKWARPQITITIVAKNKNQFSEIFDKNSQKILSLLFKTEQNRIIERNKKYSEGSVSLMVKNKLGIDLTLPKGYTYDVDTNNFIWLGYETSETIQGIFIYDYEYKDSNDFKVNGLIKARNKYLKMYVLGEKEGSYMTTELQVFPTFKSYKLNNKYTAELRGLWRVEGDFMGGPFISISQLNKKQNKIITVEGFVYAPKYNKRNYIRELEAILSSLKITE